MSKVGGGRNFGYGKKITWAAKNALNDRYGTGHFSTQASHEWRWKIFADYLKTECGIKDARDIDQGALEKYGGYLKQQVQTKSMAVAYAQNLLSTVNIVLETMRKDTLLRMSPSEWVGKRSSVRSTSPSTAQAGAGSVLSSELDRAFKTLELKNGRSLILVASLCREYGLRFKEASLLNTQRALRQAKTQGRINITEGTKGGRGKHADRWVPVTPRGLKLLQEASKLQGRNKNLIPERHNYVQWRDHAYSQWRLATHNTDIRGFHGLRAAYACERYEQITGCPAPVLTDNKRTAERSLDQKARIIIALALGHGRPQILAAYIGTAK